MIRSRIQQVFNQTFSLALALFLVSGCATISTLPAGTKQHGIPYALPKGVVPIQVFADANGIGITIEPSRTVVDNEAGQLVAQVSASPFNNEDIKLAVDPVTGFLSTITSNSDAQLLSIFEEAAKSSARLAFQNSRASFLATKVVVFDDSFDPFNAADVDRINTGLAAAFGRARKAFVSANNQPLNVSPIRIAVGYPDGSAIPADLPLGEIRDCEIGICARTQTSVAIRVLHDSAPLATKIVTVPAKRVVAVPVPSTVLANQDLSITIKGGIVEKYDLKRDSTILGLIKIPGAILSGLVAGVTENLTAEKSIVDKRKDLATSEEALAQAIKKRNDAVAAANVGETSVNLQNSTGEQPASSYAASTLTIYPFSETLTQAISQQIDAARTKAEAIKNMSRAGASAAGTNVGEKPKPVDSDLVSPAGKMKP